MTIDTHIAVLTNQQLELLHDATLETLEVTGVRFADKEALHILSKAGGIATPDGLVKIPSGLVGEALATVPHEVVLRARNPQKDVVLNGQGTYYTNGFGAFSVRDLDTGNLRPANADDLRFFTRLADYLKNVDYCLLEVTPQEVSPDRIDLELAAILLENTDKHAHISTFNDRVFDQVIELGMVASGVNAPAFSLGCSPTSPLFYARDQSQRLIKAARARVPVFIVDGAIPGNNAPVTLAGTLVVQNAEVLAGIVLSQAAQRGAPVIYGSYASPMDMRTGKQLWGVPELSLLNVATAQICRQYGVPFGYGTGGVTDSYTLGVQAGFEKALSVLFGTLAGSAVIHDAISGLLGSATVASYEQLILDNELCEMVRRLLRGIAVEKDTLVTELIREVGPRGTFLTRPHTARNFRQELYLSEVFGKMPLDSHCPPAEGPEISRARERVREILREHQATPLSEAQRKEMARILRLRS